MPVLAELERGASPRYLPRGVLIWLVCHYQSTRGNVVFIAWFAVDLPLPSGVSLLLTLFSEIFVVDVLLDKNALFCVVVWVAIMVWDSLVFKTRKECDFGVLATVLTTRVIVSIRPGSVVLLCHVTGHHTCHFPLSIVIRDVGTSREMGGGAVKL